MTYTPEDIEAMSPPVRAEIQDRIVRLYEKRKAFAQGGAKERRRPRKVPGYHRTWPRQVWHVNDSERVKEVAYLKRMEHERRLAEQDRAESGTR